MNFKKNIFFLMMMVFLYHNSLITGETHKNGESKIKMKNFFAWCIVPFDIKERTPEERISMLKELGFNSYAYDWRDKHLNEMEHEWKLAAENNININAVWIWIDAQWDRPNSLNQTNERIFESLKKVGLKTQIWLGFNSNYFEGLDDVEKINAGLEMVGYLAGRAEKIGCKVALYNHGDWFGNPENQIKIITALQKYEIGLIYNFHHGHTQIDKFNSLVDEMSPYLWAVNLNGMQKEGPKILPIGKGKEEYWMIEKLLSSGFTGPFGIIGHIEDADVRDVLIENLMGLKPFLER